MAQPEQDPAVRIARLRKLAERYGFSGSNDSVEDTIAHRDALMEAIGKIPRPTYSGELQSRVREAWDLCELVEAIVSEELEPEELEPEEEEEAVDA